MSMVDNCYNVIGIMSGTSFDGLDIALCNFQYNNNEWTFKIGNAETYAYPQEWIQTLKSAENPNSNFQEISIAYGNYIGEKVNAFIKKYNISNVSLIASHGHTIFHEPSKKITIQVGSGQAIYDKTQIKTICNFRQQDVQLGGQGAPLVPIGDQLLFKNHDVCVNLGGFANLSLKSNSSIRAWDICPVNYVLNHLTLKIGLPYDNEGLIAASFPINNSLLSQLNQLSYYSESPPKSLAREWVFKEIWPLLNNSNCPIEELIATVTEHAAIQIATTIPTGSNVLFTGGGTFNNHLLDRIKHHNGSIKISVPDQKIIDFKEALIFGFLGVLRERNEVNVLASVTGSSVDHSAGDIFSSKYHV